MGLNDEDRVSVAEQTMERAGHGGRQFHIPKASIAEAQALGFDDPRQLQRHHSAEAEDFVNGILTGRGHPGGIRVEPAHWDLRQPGSGQAFTDGASVIGLKGNDTNALALLHETAHILHGTGEGIGAHGAPFQQLAHELYHHHINPEAAEVFRGAVGHTSSRIGLRTTLGRPLIRYAQRPLTPQERALDSQRGWRGPPCEDPDHHGVISGRCADCGRRVAPQQRAASSMGEQLRQQMLQLYDMPPQTGWYHASPHDLPVGTKLVPGGAEAASKDFYDQGFGTDRGTLQDMGGGRAEHVWLSPHMQDAHFWAAVNGAPHIYEVQPHEEPRPWNGTGTDGWVTPSATITRKVSGPKTAMPWAKIAVPIKDIVPSDLNWLEPGSPFQDPESVPSDPVDYSRHNNEPSGRWFHVSPHALRPGTKLTPGGGKGLHDTAPEDWGADSPYRNRRNHVWLAPNYEKAKFWHSQVGPGAHIYEVKPGDKPQRWNYTGAEGWVAPNAHVMREVTPTRRERRGPLDWQQSVDETYATGIPGRYELTGAYLTAADDPSLEEFGTPETGNGRWHFPYKDSYEMGAGGQMHNWHIAPTDAPKTEVHQDGFGRDHTFHYDPDRVHIEPDPDGFRPTVRPNDPTAISSWKDLPDPGNMLWRGMSHEEYQQGKQRGYFQSNGSYNLGDENSYQHGKTFFSTQLPSAAHYATGFAPWQFQPTFSRPAHVIGIPDRPELPRGPGGNEPTSHEVGVPGRVPFSEVTHHYVGNVAAVKPGEVKNDVSYGRWGTPSRSLSPRVDVHWEGGPVSQRTGANVVPFPSAASDWDQELADAFPPAPDEGPARPLRRRVVWTHPKTNEKFWATQDFRGTTFVHHDQPVKTAMMDVPKHGSQLPHVGPMPGADPESGHVDSFWAGGGCGHMALAFKNMWPDLKIGAEVAKNGDITHAWVHDGQHAHDAYGTHEGDPNADAPFYGGDVHSDVDPQILAERHRINWSPEEPWGDDGVAEAGDEIEKHWLGRYYDPETGEYREAATKTSQTGIEPSMNVRKQLNKFDDRINTARQGGDHALADYYENLRQMMLDGIERGRPQPFSYYDPMAHEEFDL